VILELIEEGARADRVCKLAPPRKRHRALFVSGTAVLRVALKR
jgi:hypothetical protein